MVRDAKFREQCAEDSGDKKWFKKNTSSEDCNPAETQKKDSEGCINTKKKLAGMVRECNEERQRALEDVIMKADKAADNTSSQLEKDKILELKDLYSQALDKQKEKEGFDN